MSKNLFLSLFLIIFLSSCQISNDKKNNFINKRIKLTTQKNIDKHGELIVPEFLL